MPRTVLRSATKSPVRYSAKWRRWQSLAKRSPYRARASWTSLGNSMIPGMIVCPAVQLRQSGSGAERGGFTYFNAPPWQITKSQLISIRADGIGEQVIEEVMGIGRDDAGTVEHSRIDDILTIARVVIHL